MTLTEYLKTIGDERAAAKFGVTPRRISSWRLGERQPRPAMARRIVEMTDGLLTLSDIYAAPTNDPEAGNG
jgi:DNA-binding transcriptional regulator YdaS (Cro superfamily)